MAKNKVLAAGLRRSHIALGLLAGATLAFTAVNSAAAHTNDVVLHSSLCGNIPAGWRTCASLANNSGHTWRQDGILGNQIQYMELNVGWASDDLNSAVNFSSHRDENDAKPDVWIGDYDYGLNGARAWAACQPFGASGAAEDEGGDRANNTGWCFGQQVRFNEAYIGSNPAFYFRQHLACHELGHTVGMNHRNRAGFAGTVGYIGDESGTQTCMDSTNFDAYNYRCYDMRALERFWGTGARSCGAENLGEH